MRWLVDKQGLDVDTPAGVTGATPLMVVVTRCCVPAGVRGDALAAGGAACCQEPHPGLHEGRLGLMVSLQPMARLLLALGADPAAVDATGNSLLAVAAAAGMDGMWRDLAHKQSILPADPLGCCAPGQAGHILTALVTSQDPRGGLFPEIGGTVQGIHSIRWLCGQYSARGWSERWHQEINQTCIKRSSAYGMPAPPERFHTCAVLQAAACAAPEGMRTTLQLLLELGCRLDPLLPGQDNVRLDLSLVTWWAILKHLVKAAPENGGMDRNGYKDLALCLLAGCARAAPSAEQYAAALRALQQHGATLKRPVRLLIGGPHSGPREVHVNLLRSAVQCGTTHALLGACLVLDAQPDGRDILAMQTPPLLVAAARQGRVGHCAALLERGAHVLLPGEGGEHALWAAAGAREEAAEKAALLCEALRSRFAGRAGGLEELRARLAAEGPGGLSLAQHALAQRAHGLVGHLEALGVPLNVAYAGADPPLRAACTVRLWTCAPACDAAPDALAAAPKPLAHAALFLVPAVSSRSGCTASHRAVESCRPPCPGLDVPQETPPPHAALPASCGGAGNSIQHSRVVRGRRPARATFLCPLSPMRMCSAVCACPCAHRRCVMAPGAQAGDDALVALLVAPSQSGPALQAALRARSRDHGLTVLGSVVAWGYVRAAAILAAACRWGL